MAFYNGLSEKSKVHGDDFKTHKDKRSSFNGILQGIE
ncbi:hypothetical protein T4C_6044 [Trichinella pseudospiralis]|uniref:Uncharacterized protein n=1 Tax=Trichinella pseudospiralis TaxID=6337 RepID=A0A0V1GJT5_TRIPS|nr:hypothetical protein T4C_4569 [Trichinella pseudospiralis]KRY98469.1 hypothetical protein T4C_6044 [Trichinella pseudospiralis]